MGIREGSAGKVAKSLEETEFPPNATQAELADEIGISPQQIGERHNVTDKTESDLAELERIAGIKRGGDRKTNETEFPLVTQADLAGR